MRQLSPDHLAGGLLSICRLEGVQIPGGYSREPRRASAALAP
jgi:hypothetical protein